MRMDGRTGGRSLARIANGGSCYCSCINRCLYLMSNEECRNFCTRINVSFQHIHSNFSSYCITALCRQCKNIFIYIVVVVVVAASDRFIIASLQLLRYIRVCFECRFKTINFRRLQSMLCSVHSAVCVLISL